MTHPVRSSVIAMAAFLSLHGAPHAQPAAAAKPLVPIEAATVRDTATFEQKAERFAEDLAARRQLDANALRDVLAQARLLPNAQRLMLPSAPARAKDWQAYRARFIQPVRIRAGVRFWDEHRALLERAENRWGVPASVIVGILGVETGFGQNMGSFRVLDALATLAFEFPPSHPRAAARQAYFIGELESFLVMAADKGFDPLQPLGSYAGAMGMPQFMPSSQQRYAVDFDGDGRIDLYGSAADAIGSVANYLQAHGWQRGVAPFYPVLLAPDRSADRATLLAPDILPSFTPEQFTGLGALIWGDAANHPGKLALVELENGDSAPQYVAGTENFYAVTRYNQSSYYAMAVLELGREIKDALGS